MLRSFPTLILLWAFVFFQYFVSECIEGTDLPTTVLGGKGSRIENDCVLPLHEIKCIIIAGYTAAVHHVPEILECMKDLSSFWLVEPKQWWTWTREPRLSSGTLKSDGKLSTDINRVIFYFPQLSHYNSVGVQLRNLCYPFCYYHPDNPLYLKTSRI